MDSKVKEFFIGLGYKGKELTDLVENAKVMIAAGEGCCSPLNTDRATAISNNNKKMIIWNSIQ